MLSALLGMQKKQPYDDKALTRYFKPGDEVFSALRAMSQAVSLVHTTIKHKSYSLPKIRRYIFVCMLLTISRSVSLVHMLLKGSAYYNKP